MATESVNNLPLLLTVEEAAAVLRLSRKAAYSMIERGQMPGVSRIGRRVRIRSSDLLHFLRQKSMPLLEK